MSTTTSTATADGPAKATRPGAAQASPPHLIAAVGRGRIGKTTFLRWLAETLLDRGARPVRIWDADPEPALGRYFPQAEAPASRDFEDRCRWLEERMLELVASAEGGEPFDAVLDVGADDRSLRRLGHDVRLIETLEECGVVPVAIHLVGQSDDDLRYLRSVEQTGLFKPRKTAVVLNAGMLGAMQTPAVAFAPIIESEVIEGVKRRGGVIAVMPEFPQLQVIDDRTGRKRLFSEIAADRTVAGLFSMQRARRWLEQDMPRFRKELAEILP